MRRKDHMTTNPLSTLALITAACLCWAAPSNAQSQSEPPIYDAQFLEDIGAGARIDFSGKLRMLSQRIPAAACYYEEGILTDASGAMLTAAKEEFGQIVNALEFGDESLGIIGEEKRRKTLVGIAKLREQWEPMLAVAESIRSNGGSPDEIMAVADASAEVLEIAKLLVTVISAQYSNPTELLQVDALTIDLAGRQRMLSQRMSKNICLITAGVNVETAMGELATTAEMFDSTLTALTNGMQEVGINPPKTPEIAAALEVVAKDWAVLQPIVAQVLAGEELDDETLGIAFAGANTMTADMNTAVGLYSEASKTGL